MNVGVLRRRGSVPPILRLLLLVLVPLTVALAGCASSTKHHPATAGAAAPGTSTVQFRAYTPDGKLSVPAGPLVRGQCWTTSIAAPSTPASRCFEGNKILDPCFAPAHATPPERLACLATPWSHAVMLRVSGKLPPPAGG